MSAPLGVQVDAGRLKETSWKEYAIRFGFGGAITALTGILTHAYGPAVGGLFLAFPAILPASVTLIQHHEDHQAAGVDALGACLGSVGLLAFALAVWLLAPRLPAWLVMLIATVAWFAVSAALWAFLRWARPRSRALGRLPS